MVGLAIVGIALLFLFCLIILKLLCNLFIDIVILQDCDTINKIVNQIKKHVMMICPCCCCSTDRSNDDDDDDDHNHASHEMASTTTTTTTTNQQQQPQPQQPLIDMDMLLAGMTPKQKQELIATILTSKVSF
jgi:hypothetical protein